MKKNLKSLKEIEVDALIAYYITFKYARKKDDFGIYMDSRTCVYGDGGAYIEEYCKKYGKANLVRLLYTLFSLENGEDGLFTDWVVDFPETIHFPEKQPVKVYPLPLKWKFTFGKYQGKTVSEVIDSDPLYLSWITDKFEWFSLNEEATNKLKEKFSTADG